jgi:ankyrin repeat protein
LGAAAQPRRQTTNKNLHITVKYLVYNLTMDDIIEAIRHDNANGHLTALITASADVNALDKYGDPLLYIACLGEYIGTINALIAAGADVNAQNDTGRAPLHAACIGDSIDTVKALIAAGANVNVQHNARWTPLHVACNWGNAQIVELLLEAGADPSIRNHADHLPQDLTDNEEIKDLLENFGLRGGRATKAAQ